ncbi:hypothetical protein LXL04_033993 [Taraxacum kok-saghyz]
MEGGCNGGRRKLRKVLPKVENVNQTRSSSINWSRRDRNLPFVMADPSLCSRSQNGVLTGTSLSPVTSFRRKPNVVGLYLILPPPLSLALGLSLFSQHNRTESRFGLVGRRLEG